MFLVGRIAEVQAVLLDVEDKPYLAVSLADDPDEDLRVAHGRFLYFTTDEVEPCEASESEGRGVAWTEERGTSDEGRRRLVAPPKRAGDTA
jgi:hypothetical protein